MPIPDQLKIELNRIPHLSSIGLALLNYAESISRSSPVWESEQWVFRSANFMTIRVQSRRNNSFKISLRGNPDEFWEIDGVQLHPQMGNGAYSSFHLERPEQSAAAFLLVRTAMDNYRRGRGRHRHKPKLD